MARLLDAISQLLSDMDRERDVGLRTLDELSRELQDRLALSQASQARYTMLFDAVPHPVFVVRIADRVVLDWNSAAERTLRWSRDEVLGRSIDDLGMCHEGCAFAERLVANDPHTLSAADVVATTLSARDGSIVDVEVQGHAMMLGDVPAALVMIRDVTRQLAAERAKRESAGRFRAFFDHAGLAIAVMTVDGTIVEANPACRTVLGEGPDDLLGANIVSLFAENANLSFLNLCAELIAGTRASVGMEVQLRHRDGGVVWAHATVTLVHRGEQPHVMAMLQDVTRRKQMEQMLLKQAFRDDLTGLANRALFRDRLRHALDRLSRRRERVAVLILDLDGFKRVNDSLGHAAGDTLLNVVGQRIVSWVRGGDTVARLGGDEFAVIFEPADANDDPEHLAQRLINAISAPITIANREVVVSTSIGIAMAKTGDDPEAVLRDADTAMYSAKHAGRNCWRPFDASMHTRAIVWLELEQDLRQAIAREELELHYQPLVRLDTGDVRGFEALVRWRHPSRGLVPPGEFLPIAEETGLIVNIGRWVLHEACRQAAAWCDHGAGCPSISVNLAAQQLDEPGIVDEVRIALEQSGLDPGRLILEITESQMMKAPEAARPVLDALRALKVRIAIDDFGTGYSSLSQLQVFPVNELKIDRSFVMRIEHGERDETFVRTIVDLARALDLEVVAEGIETPAQRLILTALGCETGQGFHFSKPMPAGQVERFLSERTTGSANAAGVCA